MADPRHTMSRKYTGAEVTQAICFKAMRDWTYEKRTEAVIWASKYRECPTCQVGVGRACVNLTDVKANRVQVRVNKQPHAERIDWAKLREALQERGHL